MLAKKLGAIINLDDITHIDFLKDACGIPERICCRYNPGGIFSWEPTSWIIRETPNTV